MKTIAITILGTFLFGILNVIFHSMTDWYLGLFIGQLYGTDLTYSSNWHTNIILLNSLYSGPRLGFLSLLQILIIMVASGFFTTRIFIEYKKNKNISRLTLIMLLVFWVVKIPVTIEYSLFKGIWHGLLAW